ncbi:MULTISPECIES: LemA family protein [Cyclobacterium]|uniref:LemA family protein n=1 Tax=Cyclobacterium plantarum TaxID=2716263 RepID=A0ABX0H6Q7_9BACT|nr:MULTISPECIES: LemA family protein [Cyclobacterium]MBD3629078.1 LemA family protein [Cyclobacterium sp.]NHE57555.1 LemA family protein [Cyclobacterium plantarum]
MSTTLIIIIVAVLIGIFVVSLYNKLVAYKNNRENAFADIDVQLKQRHDLIPQLVSSVKGYMEHEAGVLTRVTEARSRAMKASTIDGKIAAEQELGAALQGLQIQVEAYPDLKANTNFLQLQNEISDVENKLAAARRYFNSATKEYNVAVQSFPSNVIAGMFGFHTETMFDVGNAERERLDQAPEIKF